MARARFLVVAAVVLAGCNALSGAADLVTADDPGVPTDEDASAPATETKVPTGVPTSSTTPLSTPDANIDGAVQADTGGGANADTGTDAKTDTGGDAKTDTDTGTADAAPDVTTVVGPRVFVTSATSNAAFGGTSGADQNCQSIANAKGFGTDWVAWVSTSGKHAKDRVTGAGPWKLVTGTLVASDKAQLVSGTLAHAIDRDENGALVSSALVWTGTTTSGNFPSLGNDCWSWSSSNAGFRGHVGTTARTDVGWTNDNDTTSCGSTQRLYCFEQ